MSLFSKRGLLVGAATFIISVAAVFAIWGLPNILARSITVKGQVTSYLLDDQVFSKTYWAAFFMCNSSYVHTC